MKKVCFYMCAVALVLLFIIPAVPAAAAGTPELSARAAVLYQPERDELVFEKNPDLRLPMASTTKVMTALLVLEMLPLDAKITAGRATVGIEGSSLYLAENDTLSAEDLLYALLLRSANDAAATLAAACCGTVEAFADEMNRRAAELGMRDTHYENPHGLDAEGHYTTARDLARLFAAAMNNPDFLRICGTKQKVVEYGGRSAVLTNHNKLLRMRNDVLAGKTGFTKSCGRCLVSAAERDGVKLIAVTLSAPDDWRDHGRLYDAGFPLYGYTELLRDGNDFVIPVTGGARKSVTARADSGYAEVFLTTEPPDCEIFTVPFCYAPVAEGDILGAAVVRHSGNITHIIPICAVENVGAVPRRGFISRLFGIGN